MRVLQQGINLSRTRIANKLIPLAFKRSRSEIAFVFDIDGVLLRGSKRIESAKPALELLNNRKIPYILLTNGGGKTEKERADYISKELDVSISPLQLVQSHTPMKALVNEDKYKRVLVVGGDKDKARQCAQNYGFKDVLMPIDIVKSFPAASPHHRFTPEEIDRFGLKPSEAKLDTRIDAVLVFNDPRDMGTDVQIVLDLLNSQNGLVSTKRNISGLENKEIPSIPIIFSNNDFLWANEYNLPRFGQGAFRIIVERLYREQNQLGSHQKLKSTIMGKPFRIQYDFAHHVLIDWRNKLLENRTNETQQILPSLGIAPTDSPFEKIYMIGDNPASDIKGANDHGWESLLLRTGVYQDSDWDTIVAKPTGGVFDNVYEAVKFGLIENSAL